MTSLFHDIIFGPVHSRRLGLSLGVNLLPTESKLCSFDCIYCECGWNAEHPGARRFNTREDVRTQLATTLRRMVADGTPPDVITFAGNGEPTMHPEFEAVIGDTIALRDELCPSARVRRVVDQMKGFDGHLTVQTMFLRGEFDRQRVDNTTEEEVAAWLRLIGEIRPRQVMVYSLDRDTPCRTLEKVPREELQAIATRVEALGIPCSVA